MTKTAAAKTITALKDAASAKDTDTLLGALLILDARDSMTELERMVHAATSDVITERHGLEDALDAILLDPESDFFGTYTEALMIALATVAA